MSLDIWVGGCYDGGRERHLYPVSEFQDTLRESVMRMSREARVEEESLIIHSILLRDDKSYGCASSL